MSSSRGESQTSSLDANSTASKVVDHKFLSALVDYVSAVPIKNVDNCDHIELITIFLLMIILRALSLSSGSILPKFIPVEFEFNKS